MSIRPAAIWSALLACLLTVLALAAAAPQPSQPRAAPSTARGRRRPVRAALERRVRRQDTRPVAAGRPGLGGKPGGLRGAPADLPGRRLAHAELGRPGAVRPHQRRLRRLPRGPARGRRRQRPRPARARDLQPPVPQHPRLGPAGRPHPRLCHRRRPGRRARAGRPRRPRRLLPARTGPGHRGGAGPLPADRGGPGHARICRTVRGTRRGRHPARPDRGGAPR